jgi:hypothetical protein
VRGKQVAVAGDTHYRSRGFTIDLSGPEDLARIMGLEQTELPPVDVERATRYAHMFFFRAMIPFPLVEIEDGRVKRFPRQAAALAPGADAHLDWICERILDGGDFGLPDELASVPPASASPFASAPPANGSPANATPASAPPAGASPANASPTRAGEA